MPATLFALRARLFIPAIVTTLTLCQCGTVMPAQAAPLADGEPLAIAYQTGGTTFVLRNRSAVDVEQQYSAGAARSLKVADDDTLNKLLEGFGQTQFFAHATPAAPGQARGSIAVHRGGARYVYAELPPRLTSQERFTDFQQCAQLFRYVFDNTRAYHSGSMSDFDAKTQQMMRNAQPQQVRTRGRK